MLAACGGDDDFEAPTCSEGTLSVESTTGGGSSGFGTGLDGHSFVNTSDQEPGTLELYVGTEVVLSLEFQETVPHGGSTAARGEVNFEGTHFGNCGSSDFPGTLRIDEDGEGGTFRLIDLHPQADCNSDQVSGEIVGCFRYVPFGP